MNERKKESGESKCEVVEKGVGKKLPRNIYICNASKPILDWSLISIFFFFFLRRRAIYFTAATSATIYDGMDLLCVSLKE